MTDKKPSFAEVTRQAREKRSQTNSKAAARKAADIRDDAAQVAARFARENKKPNP